MFLIAGLGNPEEKYENTRHNAGRRIVKDFGKKHDFPVFDFDKKSNSLISKNKKIVLCLPETYMNNSGKAIKTISDFYKIKPGSTVIVHDDSDISLGKIKICKNRSSGGHKGVESVIKTLKTKDFIRIRIGIGQKKHKDAMEMVLKKFSKADEKTLSQAKKKALSAINIITSQTVEKAMSELNK